MLVTSGLSGMKMVNTSFNVRGESIVCSPEDTFICFMGTELDLLVVGNFVLKKRASKYLISRGL